jgi:hypothetical protein
MNKIPLFVILLFTELCQFLEGEVGMKTAGSIDQKKVVVTGETKRPIAINKEKMDFDRAEEIVRRFLVKSTPILVDPVKNLVDSEKFDWN